MTNAPHQPISEVGFSLLRVMTDYALRMSIGSILRLRQIGIKAAMRDEAMAEPKITRGSKKEIAKMLEAIE